MRDRGHDARLLHRHHVLFPSMYYVSSTFHFRQTEGPLLGPPVLIYGVKGGFIHVHLRLGADVDRRGRGDHRGPFLDKTLLDQDLVRTCPILVCDAVGREVVCERREGQVRGRRADARTYTF